MPLRFTIWSFAIFLGVFSSSAWAVSPEDTSATKTDHAKKFVAALETWDKTKNQPAQPQVAPLKVVTLEETVKGNSPASTMRLVINYPQSTGNPKVDKLLKEQSEVTLANFRQAAKAFTAKEATKPGLHSRTFLVSKSSLPRYMSVIFYDYMDVADDFPHWTYEVVTFDLKEGRQLTANDAFPESDEGSKISGFFVNYINAALDNQCLSSGDDCWPSAIDLKKTDQGGDRHMAITPDGTAVIYGPYVLGKMVEVTKFIDIPKQQMVDWGMSDYFWIER